MKVEKVDHIHIYVKDLDKAIRFFSEVLGTKFTVPGEGGEGNEELEFTEAMDPLGLELVAPTSPDGVVGRAVERRGEGLAGLSLKVPNIEEATAEMESRGIRVVSRIQAPGIKEVQFHPRDCHGVMIELTEYEEQPACVAAALIARQRQT